MLYTDGLTEARTGEAQRLGVEGLCGFVEREAAASRIAPGAAACACAMRCAGTRAGDQGDDATALLIEWKRGGGEAARAADRLTRAP